MATYNGVNYTKARTNSPTNVLSSGTLAGKVRVMMDSYEFSGATVGVTTILMGQELPKGAKILQVILGSDALASTHGNATSTISVGDQASTARYYAATSVSNATVAVGPALVDQMADVYEVTGTTDNVIRLTSAGSISAGTVRLCVYYAAD